VWKTHLTGALPIVAHCFLDAVGTAPEAPVALEGMMKALFIVATMVIDGTPSIDGLLSS